MEISNEISGYFAQYPHLLTKKFAIACSGGIDSICLAFAINNIYQNFVCLICDHAIRKNSSDEAMQVADYLTQCNINAEVIKTTKIDTSKNLELNAREARYRALFKFCIKNNIHDIFMAHHLDDNIETFLMRLERGTGLNGLAATMPQSVFKVFYGKKKYNITIHRPFLNLTKLNLMDFLKQHNLKYWHDSTNDDSTIKRNFIRKYLADNTIDDNLKNNLQITISNLTQDLRVIEDVVSANLKKTCKNNQIDCIKFKKLPQSVRFKILQEFINNILFKKQISTAGLNNLLIYNATPIRMEKILNLDSFLSNAIEKSKHQLKGIAFEICNNVCSAKII